MAYKYSTIKKNLLVINLILFSALSFGLCLYESPAFLSEIITSDTLLPAALVWDLDHNPTAWQSFQLPRIPSLVPDLLLYWTLQQLSGSWRLAHLIFGLLSLLALTSLAATLVRRITGRPGGVAFLLLAMALLAAEVWGGGPPETALHTLFLYPVSHGGPFLWALASLLVGARFLASEHWRDLAILVPMLIAGYLSDRLFLLTAILPLAVLTICALRLDRGKAATAARMAAASLLSLAVAGWLDQRLLRQPDFRLDLSLIATNAILFLKSPVQPLGAEAPLLILLGLALPVALFLSFRPARLGANAVAWWWAALASMAASMAATALVYYDVPSYRYLSPLLWWPIIFAAARLALLPRLYHRLAGGLLALWLVGAGLLMTLTGWRRPAILSWHDPLTLCLQQAAREQGLAAGLSEYWYARFAEAMSDWHLQLDQITIAGMAFYWGNDPYWYFHDKTAPDHVPPYNFILMAGHPDLAALTRQFGPILAQRRENGAAGFAPEQITALYGPPDRVLSCPTAPGETRDRGAAMPVWVYRESGALQPRLIAASPWLQTEALRRQQPLFIFADRLSSRDHRLQSGWLDATPPAGGGAASWGPYLHLPAGRYRIALRYRLSTLSPAHWRITEDAGRILLFEGNLPANSDNAQIEAEIASATDLTALEVVTLLPEDSAIAVGGLTITPLPPR